MKLITISILILISVASALAITGTNDQNNINITRGQISFAPIVFNETISVRGSAQYIAGLGNDTSMQTRFGILVINEIPDTPTIIQPTNDSYKSYNEIEFEWTAEDQNNDTLTSLFELFNDTEFTQVYHRNFTLEETNYNVTIPEEMTLYWRVMVNDTSKNSSFSEINTITIDTTPPTNFSLSSPANNTQSTDTTPELTWTPTTELYLSNYTVELCDSADCGNTTFLGATSGNSFSNWTSETSLDEAKTYYWRVRVFDKANNNNVSDDVSLYILEASATDTVTVTTGGGGGERIGGSGTQLFSLSIISPPDITLVKDNTITIPLTIKNPARLVTLRGITLSIVSDSEEIIPALGQTSITQLTPGQQTIVPLTLTAIGQPGAYGMTITATVSSPDFVDKVRILANLIEAGAATSVENSRQLDFAKDLINGNPECLELKEYIDQVEEALNSGDSDKAFSILEATISNCQQLISTEKSSLTSAITGSAFEVSYLLKENQTVVILTVETLAFLLVVGIAIKVIRKKKTTTSKS